jgi:hypothetical protein
MYIFNTTYLVSDKMHGIWHKWLYEEHIPFMEKSGYFSNRQISKVLSNEQQDGTSYSVQFHIPSLELLEEWEKQYGEQFLHNFSKKFGEEVLLFSTILEVMK